MRRYSLLIALFLISLVATLSAQAPDTLWTKTLEVNKLEYFTSVGKTTDDGFILGGFTELASNSTKYYWLVRLDSEGDTVWTKTYLADEKYDDQQVIQTSDGGFAIAGDGDPWLIKTDADGVLEWQQARSTIGENANILAFEETDDGGFIATGSDESGNILKVLVVKTDNTGAVEWSNTYGGEHDAVGSAVTETSDGEIAVAGAKQHPTGGGVNHGWLLKLSASGDSLWSTVHGDTADASFRGFQETADSGFVLIGKLTLPSQDKSDIWLVRTDSLGVVEWEQAFGGADDDDGFAVVQTSDLGFSFVAMGAVEPAGDAGGWAVHTDTDGETTWTLLLGDPSYNFGLDLVEIEENEYLVAGGRIDWDLEEALGWVIRLGTDTPVTISEGLAVTPIKYALHANYPNPFNPVTTIRFDLPEIAEVSLIIYDLLGREVVRLADGLMEPGYYTMVWNSHNTDGMEMPTGVYIARLVTTEYSKSIRMVLLK